MQLTMPTFDLPWRRKTPLERTQGELQKLQKQIAHRVDKIELPKIKSEEINTMVDDTKKAVGSGMDQLAVAAGQLGREAGKLGRKAGKRGGELKEELTKAGDENLKNLRADLKGLSQDVRSLRVTREKRGPDIMPGIALLAGLGTGLAAMFFFDPEQGRRRRALLRDQVTKWSRVAGESLSGQMQDLRNRSIGVAHELRRGVESATGSGDGQTEQDLAGATPDASMDLASTDQAATEQPVAQPAGSAWGEELSVPEGSEGQPELNRPH